MKVKQALEITKTMGYTVPEDMTDEAMLYWSKSKISISYFISMGEWQNSWRVSIFWYVPFWKRGKCKIE